MKKVLIYSLAAIMVLLFTAAWNGEPGTAGTPVPADLTVVSSKAVVNHPDSTGVFLFDVPSEYGTILRTIVNGSTVTLTGERRLTEGEWWAKVRNDSYITGWMPEAFLVISSGIEPGDTFTFGTLEQDNDTENGPEAIEWIVLAAEDDSILVISRYGLDVKPYNNEGAGTDWGSSYLRDWMNNEFFESAFTDAEKALIIPVPAADGSSETDRIFQLEIDDVSGYFEGQDTQKCELTAYAAGNGGTADLIFWRPVSPAESGTEMVAARPAFRMNISGLADSGHFAVATPTADPSLTLTPVFIPPTPTVRPTDPVIPAPESGAGGCHLEPWGLVCD
ncbi:MAG: SH3 domain-containing protein [Anaerolineaceae bacterium]|nr:SH3 domain-containing protein [Anaerolineaceae bacterium]